MTSVSVMKISSRESGISSAKTGSFSETARMISLSSPLTVIVHSAPRVSKLKMSSDSKSPRVFGTVNAHCSLCMPSFMSSRSFENSIPPLWSSPTWSQRSSSSRRLWEATTGVSSRAPISFIKRLFTACRAVGSSPSNVSSKKIYSHPLDSAQMIALWPLHAL